MCEVDDKQVLNYFVKIMFEYNVEEMYLSSAF